jgi:RNA polymerase sigma-70 factor (ECF subfamily)
MAPLRIELHYRQNLDGASDLHYAWPVEERGPEMGAQPVTFRRTVTGPRQEPYTPDSSPPASTSLSLIARWQRGELRAWERLVYLYYPLVYGWCRRGGAAPDQAQDVAQEVFAALAGDNARFQPADGQNSFRGWLWGVTRNQWRYYQRKQRRQPAAVGGENSELDQIAAPDEQPLPEPAADEDAGVFRRAIDLVRLEFEDRTWQAFWRTTVDNQPGTAIAEELAMTVNAVYLAKSRVLRRLRQELEGLVDW